MMFVRMHPTLTKRGETVLVPMSVEDFATGWEEGNYETMWGKPYCVITLYDGSLLISDDHNEAIYRISYAG